MRTSTLRTPARWLCALAFVCCAGHSLAEAPPEDAARTQIRDRATRSLCAAHADQTSRIKQRLAEMRDQAVSLSENRMVVEALRYFILFRQSDAGPGTDYARLHGVVHPVLQGYVQRHGYHELLLVADADRSVVYRSSGIEQSVESLNHNLVEAIRTSEPLGSGETALQPFLHDTHQNKILCSVAVPIFDGDERLGVAVLRAPIELLTIILTAHRTLGESAGVQLTCGEVRVSAGKTRGESSPKPRIRLVSRSTQIDHEVLHQRATQGKSGYDEILNAQGEPSIAAYGPLAVLGHDASLVLTRSLAEIESPFDVLQATSEESSVDQSLLLLLAMTTLVAVAFGAAVLFLLSTRKSGSAVTYSEQLKPGLGADASRTLAHTSAAILESTGRLKQEIEAASSDSALVASASGSLATDVASIADSSNQIAEGIRAVSEAAEQMTEAVGEISTNTSRSAQIAEQASEFARSSNEKIGGLDQASQQIGAVVQVIQDIAEQTNLLALNATIEAARAGDAGKGFAVVASEVRELSSKTASATSDIRDQIQHIQSATGDAVGSMHEIDRVIGQLREIAHTVAGAVEEQSITTREINDSMARVASSADEVSSKAEQSSVSSESILNAVARLDVDIRKSAESAALTNRSGRELADAIRALDRGAEETVDS